MSQPTTSTGYYWESLHFIKMHFKQLWWAFLLPVVGAIGLVWAVFQSAVGLLEWLSHHLPRPSWLPAWMLDVGTGFFGVLLALVFLYLLFVPLVRLCLAPLLGLYVEKHLPYVPARL